MWSSQRLIKDNKVLLLKYQSNNANIINEYGLLALMYSYCFIYFQVSSLYKKSILISFHKENLQISLIKAIFSLNGMLLQSRSAVIELRILP